MASTELKRMDDEVRHRQHAMGEHKDALSALKSSSAKHKILKKRSGSSGKNESFTGLKNKGGEFQ